MRTLAFPYTATMAEPVYCYTFSPELNNTWQDLTRRYTREQQQLPYRDLTTAMRYVSRDYVTIRKDPDNANTLLLARKKLPSDTVARLFATFERQLAEKHAQPFDNALAPLAAEVRPHSINLAKHLLRRPGAPGDEPPAWVYDVATWHAIDLLKGAFALPNGAIITLRPDTEGNLVAFDHPLPEHHPRGEQGIHYISLTPLTLPGYPGILLNLDAHISATTGWPRNARSLWIAADEDGVLLNAGQRYDPARGVNLITGMLPVLIDSFSIKQVPTEFLPSDLTLGRIRARHASPPNNHPIAAGPGRKFLESLLDHATTRLGIDSLVLHDSKIRNVNVKKDAEATALQAQRFATGIKELQEPIHLTVIYANDMQRARSAAAITDLLGIDDEALWSAKTDLMDGALTVSFLGVEKPHELLDPAKSDARTDIIESAANPVPPQKRHIALVETSKDRGTKGNDTEDPKHQLRRMLGARGVVTQFIDSSSAPRSNGVDYAARGAVRDLFRAAGLTSTTPTRAFAAPLVHQPCVLVGVFTHERTRPAQRMVSLAALVTDGTDRPWQMLGYHPDAGGWNTLPKAISAHHATALSAFDDRDSGIRAVRAREYIERALHHLRIRYDDLPIVIFVDASERFTVWPGLTNKHLGSHESGHLPHLAMADLSTIALVRVNTSAGGKLLQPARELIARKGSHPSLVPGSEKLYRLDGASADAFYLINRSRSDRANDFGVKVGQRMTRFEAKDDQNALRTPWHAMTCTEFVLIDRGHSDASNWLR